MPSLANLFADFKVSTSQFQSEMNAAVRSAKEFDKQLKSTKEVLTTNGTGMTVIGAAISGALIAAAKSAANYGDTLAKASQRTGASVEELAKLKFAAEQSGASFDDLNAGLRFLAKNAEAAAGGSKEQSQAFKNL